MPEWRDIVYQYDGTFDGLMCCIFESYEKKEMPQNIEPFDAPQATLFSLKYISTCENRAQRVKTGIAKKISEQAYDLVRNTFLTCAQDKEIKILKFLRLGFKLGAKVTGLLSEPAVDDLIKPVRHMLGEVHLLSGFLRFSECEGYLTAQIEPKNNVLPLLVPHFCDRFSAENFIICDRIHGLIFLHEKSGRMEFMEAEDLQMPVPDEKEESFRRLWKLFVKTIAIEGRINYKNQRTHMPKRYWPMMTENEDRL